MKTLTLAVYSMVIIGALTLLGIVCVCSASLYENKKPIGVEAQGVEPMNADHGLSSVAQSETLNEFRTGPDGLDLGGVSRVSPNTTIHWKSVGIPDSRGTTPLDVLYATRDRLQHLQGGVHASNDQAKALWNTLEAINSLEGKNNLTETHLGAPLQ